MTRRKRSAVIFARDVLFHLDQNETTIATVFFVELASTACPVVPLPAKESRTMSVRISDLDATTIL